MNNFNKNIIVGVLIGVILFLGMILLLTNTGDQDVYVIKGDYFPKEITQANLTLNQRGFDKLSWNDINLTDHTVYNEDGSCVAENNGIKVSFDVCDAPTISGRNIETFAEFSTDKQTTFLFVYTAQLESGKMYLWKNYSHTYNEIRDVDVWVNNYLVTDVASYNDLGTPDERCELGNSNNIYMYDVTTTNSSSYIYCFSERTIINATAFRISGNRTATQNIEETGYKFDWFDITDEVSDFTNQVPEQMRNNFSFYKVSDVPAGNYSVKWVFTPAGNIKTGKWHILGFPTADGLTNSYILNKYMYQDPSWNSTYSDGLMVYYKFDETSGSTAEDVVYGHNLSLIGSPAFVTGKIGNALNFTGSTYAINTTYIDLPVGAEHRTANFWFYLNQDINAPNGEYFLSYGQNSLAGQAFSPRLTPGQLNKLGYMGYGASYDYDPGISLTKLTWYMATYTYNGTSIGIYLNGVYQGSKVQTPVTTNLFNFTIGGRTFPTRVDGIHSLMDEVSIWNRSLTQAEITDLYNSGDGITYTESAGDGISIFIDLIYPIQPINISPIFDYNQTTENGNFTNGTLFLYNSTGDDVTSVYSTSVLCLQDISNASTACGGLSTGNVTKSGSPTAEYEAVVFDNNWDTGIGWAGAVVGWNIFYKKPPRNIDWVNTKWEVKDGVGRVNLTIPEMCWNSYDDYLFLATRFSTTAGVLSAWYCYNQTDYVRLRYNVGNDTLYDEAMNWVFQDVNVTEGTYDWNIYGCGENTTTVFCNWSDSNGTFLYDITAPSITILYPSGDLPTLEINQNVTINFSITDVLIDTCWLNYGGVNTFINCSLNTSLIYDGANKTFSIYGNDSAGNLKSEIGTLSAIYIVDSISYNETVFETQNVTFALNISYNTSYSLPIVRYYFNGTTISPTITDNGGQVISTATVDVPLGEGNKTFYYTISLYNGTAYNTYTSANYNTTVSTINLEVCYTDVNLTKNFTVYDEASLSKLSNISYDGTFFYYIGGGTVYKNLTTGSLTDKVNIGLCSGRSTLNYYADAVLDYGRTGYIERTLYWDYEPLTVGNYSLYLLNVSDYTSFIVQVKDQSLTEVTGALIEIQRYYPENNTYNTVQIVKTDDNGESVAFYKTETVDYKHLIYKNNILLLETTAQKIVGKTVPYTLTFIVGDVLSSPISLFDDNESITATLTFNKTTNIVTFTYIDVNNSVELGQLFVKKNNLANVTESVICNVQTTESSSTLTCNLTGESGTFTAYGYLDGVNTNLIVITITGARDIFGTAGLFIALFIIMVAGFAFIWNPSAGIISINVAIITVNIIGLISVSPIFIFGGIAISIIALVLMRT